MILASLSTAAWFLPLGCKQRRQATAIGISGIGLILLIQLLHMSRLEAADRLFDWAPALWILTVYWQCGKFFTQPNQKLQDALERFDRNHASGLLKSWTCRWSKTWLGTFFELAYLLCYPLLPVGVAMLYAAKLRSAADAYWTPILISTYLCYLVLPFAQTIPPRSAGPGLEFPATRMRRLNLWLLRHASIQVNTFPSAHVASSVAASLALLRLVPIAGIVFLILSACIAVAAVLGRYHFLLDVLTGAAIPVITFIVFAFLDFSAGIQFVRT